MLEGYFDAHHCGYGQKKTDDAEKQRALMLRAFDASAPWRAP
jgi:hypothetical protein